MEFHVELNYTLKGAKAPDLEHIYWKHQFDNSQMKLKKLTITTVKSKPSKKEKKSK